MPRFGYARVSSTDQDLTIQLDKLKAAGCNVIRSEKMSGKSADDRPELATVMQFLREGDELVVVRLDRLGRSTRDVLNLVHELDQKGASLRILDPEMTTGGDVGRIVVTVLGMVAEMERKFILERQRAGIEAAKGAGVYEGKGRVKTVPDKEIRRRHAAGEGPAAIARHLGISRTSVYRALKANDHASAAQPGN
ncbi:recombinase family protein [Methylorubrum populi]|uniref:recombinase family protein n=1 Tax=Methylorubrum populi TaxID=223967 RepID=UPI0031F785CF